MAQINSFEEMEVYIEAFKFQNRVLKMTRSWPKEEMYSLTDQIEACKSIGRKLGKIIANPDPWIIKPK